MIGNQGFLLIVALFIMGMLGVGLTSAGTSAFADQPSGLPKIVLHVKAETCQEAQSVFPVLSAGRDRLFNSSTKTFGFTAVSCDESSESAHLVYVTDQFVGDRFHRLQLVMDH